MELGPVNVILNQSVLGERQIVIFFEAGVLFGNDTIHAKAGECDGCNGQFFSVGVFNTLGLLVGNGVFLVVRLVRAFSDIHQIGVPVFTRCYVLQYLTFIINFLIHW